MKKIFFFVLTLLCFGTIKVSNAQIQLSEGEKEVIHGKIEDIVFDFNAKVGEIWRRPNKVESQNMEKFREAKEMLIDATMKLFIGDGKPFEEDIISERWNGEKYEEFTEKVNHRAVIMETSIMNSRKTARQTIESYLRKASKGIGSQVEIVDCEAYYARDLKEVAPGKYEATMICIQSVMSYDKERHEPYIDRTTMTIRVYLTPTILWGEVVIHIKLGDIKVVETQRM